MRKRFWRRWGVLVIGVVVLAGAAGAAVVALREPARTPQGPDATPRATAPPPTVALRDDASMALVTVVGDERDAVALVVFGDGHGTIVQIADTATIELPGLGPRTLTQAGDDGYPALVAVGVANALGIRTPAFLSGDAVGVGGVGPTLVVAVSQRVTIDGTAIEAGTHEMEPDLFAAYMTAEVEGGTAEGRLARQRDGWRALIGGFASVGDELDIAAWSTDLRPEPLVEASRDAARDLRALTVPVRGTGLRAERVDTIDPDRLDSVLSVVSEHRVAEIATVRLLVATSAPVGAEVGALLVDNGFRIVLSGRAVEDRPDTRITAASESQRETTDTLRSILGVGTVEVRSAPDDLADIMLVVGQDWTS